MNPCIFVQYGKIKGGESGGPDKGGPPGAKNTSKCPAPLEKRGEWVYNEKMRETVGP